MHRINKHREIVRINIRRDAMPQVEYMSRTVTEACEHLRNTLFDSIGRFPKNGWIQVSL